MRPGREDAGQRDGAALRRGSGRLPGRGQRGDFEEIPVKKEVKATVSGLYITGVRGLRGPLEKPQGKQKKSLRAKLQSQYDKANKKLQEEKQKK